MVEELGVAGRPSDKEADEDGGAAGPREAASQNIERGTWDHVRADFEGEHLSEGAICRKHGVRAEEMWTRAKKNKWRSEHRLDGLDRAILIRQMFSVLERHVANLETAEMTESGEKEASVLGKLVTTLDKLIEIDGRVGGRKDQRETREMADLRNKLARRIDRLKRG